MIDYKFLPWEEYRTQSYISTHGKKHMYIDRNIPQHWTDRDTINLLNNTIKNDTVTECFYTYVQDKWDGQLHLKAYWVVDVTSWTGNFDDIWG